MVLGKHYQCKKKVIIAAFEALFLLFLPRVQFFYLGYLVFLEQKTCSSIRHARWLKKSKEAAHQSVIDSLYFIPNKAVSSKTYRLHNYRAQHFPSVKDISAPGL